MPVVILSLGKDWAEFDAADVDASENSGEATLDGYDMPADLDFVDAAYIEDTFDDLITWMSSSIFFTKMIMSQDSVYRLPNGLVCVFAMKVQPLPLGKSTCVKLPLPPPESCSKTPPMNHV